MLNDSQNTPGEYESLLELLPAYSFGFTDPDETKLVEQLLVKYPEAAHELEAYHALNDAMLTSVPQVAPPERVLVNLLDATSREDAPPSPAKIILFRQWYVTAAAVVLFLVMAGVVLALTIRNLQRNQEALNEQIEAQRTILNLVASEDLVRFELLEIDNTGASGYVLCHPDERAVLVRASNFPPLEADMNYQIWLIQDEQRYSGGVFNVDVYGNGTFVFNAPDVMRNFQYIGITPERAGGSPEPTAPPVARGALYNNGGSAWIPADVIW